MKVTYIGHSALLVETRGVRILSDPWWRGPCFGAQWWVWPRPSLEPLEAAPVDFVYISHGHHDHLHPGTLSTLAGRPTLLVAKSLDLAAGLHQTLGLPVQEIDAEETIELAEGVTGGIWPTHGGDTLMWITDGDQVLVNANDALHSAPREVQERFVGQLKERFRRIDYFFCGFATASHFPNCYEMPGVDRVATARRRQHYFNDQWLWLARALNPKFAYPFAGDVMFLEEDLFWLNAALHNDPDLDRKISHEFSDAPESGTVASRIGPGFAIEDGVIVDARPRPSFDTESARAEFSDEIQRANRYGSLRGDQLDELAELLRNKLSDYSLYFGSCPFDYQYALTFREGKGAIVVAKLGDRFDVRVTDAPPQGCLEVVTRAAYLRYALETRYGHEVLFVGSGVRFRYPDLGSIRPPVHQEAMALLRPMKQDGRRPVSGPLAQVKARIKGAIRAISGKEALIDLYDLDAWLVREAPPQESGTLHGLGSSSGSPS